MSVATSTAIAIGAGVSAAGAIGGAAISAHAQSSATNKATQAQEESAANTLAFQKQVYGDTLANEQPYLDVGKTGANELNAGLLYGDLLKPWDKQFSFTGVDLQNDPAYNFDLQQGQQGIQRSAAASGGLVSGGALKDLNDYTQGYASNQFQQSYANALGQYQQAYNQFEGDQANRFNRLSSVAGLGQNAATLSATSGNAAAGTVANTNANTANQLSNLYTGQGNATAGATMAGVNALSSGVNSYANYLAQTSGSSYQTGPYTPPPMGNVTPDQWAAYDAGSTPV